MFKLKTFNKFNEGVGDKYAKRAFNLPDIEEDFEKEYKNTLYDEQPFGYSKSFSKVQQGVAIYKNPKTLKKFDEEVRAILDKDGNIYVAIKDGMFDHGMIAYGVGFAKDRIGIYKDLDNYVLLCRIYNKNSFGLSDSSDSYANISDDNRKKINEILYKAKIKNPQYNFYDKFYQEF
jgi:hypothetical protein